MLNSRLLQTLLAIVVGLPLWASPAAVWHDHGPHALTTCADDAAAERGLHGHSGSTDGTHAHPPCPACVVCSAAAMLSLVLDAPSTLERVGFERPVSVATPHLIRVADHSARGPPA
jgi:hypothetical protein